MSAKPSRQQIGFQRGQQRATLNAALGPEGSQVDDAQIQRALAHMMPGEFSAYRHGVESGINESLCYNADDLINYYQANLGYKGEPSKMLVNAYESGIITGRMAKSQKLIDNAKSKLQGWEEEARKLDASI